MAESFATLDARALANVEVLVVEDPCGNPDVTKAYASFCEDYGFHFVSLPQWSNMHGAAAAAFEHAEREWSPTWIVYLGDDVLATPYALSNLLYFITENELNTIGLVQVPYWNAHDLTGNKWGDWIGPTLLYDKRDMWVRDVEWLKQVPRNPHWDGYGIARPYVNVNGAGFACRTATYFEAGGFAEGTWCLDESISLRVWTNTDKGICCLPGPPFVHYFGGSTESDPPVHDLYTEEAWIAATGYTKKQTADISYAIMEERSPAMFAELAAAKYYEVPS